MPRQNNEFIFSLAKLLIAFGWADGKLGDEEITAIKNSLFKLGNLNAEQWGELELFMENPVDETQRNKLATEMANNLRSNQDIELVREALETVIQADGVVADEEKAAMEKFLEDIKAGISGSLGLLLKNFFKRSVTSLNQNRQLENSMAEFVKNKILFHLKKTLSDESAEAARLNALTEKELQKLTAMAALLGRVALTDGNFSKEEQSQAADALCVHQGIDRADALLVVDIACHSLEKLKDEGIGEDIDYYHYTHIFFENTDYSERVQFLKSLFLIANASDKTSFQEIEQIRSIAIDLKVDHSDFIQAKLTIPRGDRKGL